MKICDTSVLVDIDRGGVDEKVATLDEADRHAINRRST
jgi:tRNA(fMet)-specific endonuclease VapC